MVLILSVDGTFNKRRTMSKYMAMDRLCWYLVWGYKPTGIFVDTIVLEENDTKSATFSGTKKEMEHLCKFAREFKRLSKQVVFELVGVIASPQVQVQVALAILMKLSDSDVNRLRAYRINLASIYRDHMQWGKPFSTIVERKVAKARKE